ncbi:TlpA disulfide reductase family protein [Cupriavidus taiwanensis]|uniref:Putative disulfite reductase/thioredoxin, putative soxW homolog n=1 Tax=Cupriavidus taiwanensis TaxID=164546 RepID=A0A375J3S2_9BURK|nr:TlpA disulfide reductase family protein [Cupriavidus taiwanensis]SPR98613.1 putative disulfite reductase/thioredoxin, putative soxW homolog [Cupriavidus taiwanensis]
MRAPAMLLRALLAASLMLAAAGAAALEVGDTVRLPELRTLDGRTLSAAALAGKPLVVEYWATWCPFCAMQNPRLQKLYERTRGTPLQVLAISIDKDPREAADYMKKRGYTFPATMDSAALQAVFGKRKGLPELYVIDARGRVVQKEVGEMLEDEVAALERYAKP